jgi:flagellar biogenesis protein FliO
MDFIQPFAAIVFVMALLGGALLLLKKRGGATLRFPAAGPRRLEVIERVSLGPQHSLHLVRPGDRMLLIATAPNSCQILDTAVFAGDRA